MKWYLAGPMSGIKKHNYPAFTAACILLRDQGWDIISPHESHPFMETRDTTTKEWQALLKEDIRILLDCQGIILLRGWSNSKGAQLECYVAVKLGMPVKFLRGDEVVDITIVVRYMADTVVVNHERHTTLG